MFWMRIFLKTGSSFYIFAKFRQNLSLTLRYKSVYNAMDIYLKNTLYFICFQTVPIYSLYIKNSSKLLCTILFVFRHVSERSVCQVKFRYLAYENEIYGVKCAQYSPNDIICWVVLPDGNKIQWSTHTI